MADLGTNVRYIKGIGEARPPPWKSWALPPWGT